MTLRARLSLGLVVLAAFALAAAGTVTYSTLRQYLYDRLDRQLDTDIHRPLTAQRTPLAPGGYLVVTGPRGDSVTFRYEDEPAPDLEGVTSGYQTVGAVEGSRRFRVLMTDLSGQTRVLALPLDDVERTLERLLATELVVAGIVLAALAGLGWFFVHRELRPLERMGATAGAIAAGDLSQRVDTANERTD